MPYAPSDFQVVANPAAYEFDLADRLRKTLTANKVSVEQAAHLFEVSRNSVGNWINGRVVPDRRTLIAWSSIFAVPLPWLETGEWPRDAAEAYVDAIRAENGLPPIFANDEAPAEAGAVVRPEGFEPPTV